MQSKLPSFYLTENDLLPPLFLIHTSFVQFNNAGKKASEISPIYLLAAGLLGNLIRGKGQGYTFNDLANSTVFGIQKTMSKSDYYNCLSEKTIKSLEEECFNNITVDCFFYALQGEMSEVDLASKLGVRPHFIISRIALFTNENFSLQQLETYDQKKSRYPYLPPINFSSNTNTIQCTIHSQMGLLAIRDFKITANIEVNLFNQENISDSDTEIDPEFLDLNISLETNESNAMCLIPDSLSQRAETIQNKTFNKLSFFVPPLLACPALLSSRIQFNPEIEETSVKKYQANNPKDINRFVRDNGYKFRYDHRWDNHDSLKQVSVEIATVSSLAGPNIQYGIFATEDIKLPAYKSEGKYIIFFSGEFLTLEEYAKLNNLNQNAYIFDIHNRKTGDLMGCINGHDLRNWSAFMNHSFTPNIGVEEIRVKIKGKFKTLIGFYPITEIKKGQQLLYNYSAEYFVNYDAAYLDPADNWIRCSGLYNKNKQYYAKFCYHFFNEEIKKDLGLTYDSDLVIPSLFIDIDNNNVEALSKKLQEAYPTELLVYEVKDNKFLDSEHLTALMLACYFQRLECIRVLIKANANCDRHMFRKGFSPLTLYLKRKPLHTKEATEEVAIQLLNKMIYPFVQDNKKLNCLHYAILRNYNCLIEALFKRANFSGYQPFDLVSPLIENNKACLFDFCIHNQRWETLEILLKYHFIKGSVQLNGKIKDYIAQDQCFKIKILEKLNLHQLQRLSEVLKIYEKQILTGKRTLLLEVENLISNLSNEDSDNESKRRRFF